MGAHSGGGDSLRVGGDGKDIAAMRAQIKSLGLEEKVKLLGFVKDRTEVLEKYREADVFMFCHKTPDSPRCLIEALISGTPIVGYEGTFAQDLIAGHGGGRLVPLGDIDALVAQMQDLVNDWDTLAQMIANAVKDGAPYDDESVFAHRSHVIQKHL